MKNLKDIFEGILDKDNKGNVGSNLDSLIEIPSINDFRKNDLAKTYELVFKSDYFNTEILTKTLDGDYFRYYTPDLVKHGIKIVVGRERGIGNYIEFYTVTRSLAWTGFLGRLETNEKNYDKIKKQVIRLLHNIKYKDIGKDLIENVFNDKKGREHYIEDYI